MRQFRDAAGIEWRVYQTERNATVEQRRDHLLPAEYLHGWLVFESATEKRRLAPVPEGWSDLTDVSLAELCALAPVQVPRAKGSDRPISWDAVDSEQTGAADAGSTLGAQLKRVEARLSETLDEVCETPPAEKLDTGELIRVEETLSIAAEVAKEAVSLRREQGTQRDRR